jgi:hypothetical protein
MTQQFHPHRRVASLLLAALLIASGSAAQDDEMDNTIDPSGTWESPIGTLSLLHSADTLSFSYSSVFGPTAHLCLGAGVAGLVGRNRYEYEDEQGAVAFILLEDRVEMETVTGIASFCGAGWPGDVFSDDGFIPPTACTVGVERSVFHVVDHVEAEPRRSYVVSGDLVETVPAPHDPDQEWLLARFTGENITTVGLLRAGGLRCSASEAQEECRTLE